MSTHPRDTVIKALDDSIEKWKTVKGVDSIDGLGASSCPLCALFYHDDCINCPVSAVTGLGGCVDTPYEWFEYSLGPFIDEIDDEEVAKHAALEVEFLQRARDAYVATSAPRREVGYVIWDAAVDEPYRAERSKGRWFARKDPPRVYKTEARAKAYAPPGKQYTTKRVFTD